MPDALPVALAANPASTVPASRPHPMTQITHGMVLAAGLGLRMRPITETLPKPLVSVAGRTLLDRALDHLAAAGIGTAVVNTHHLGDQIVHHLKGRAAPEIVVSPEDELLETGGGVLKALGQLGDAPFFVANSDALWGDGPTPALARMMQEWDPDRMDALLLIHSTVRAVGYGGRGDFFIAVDGRLRRRREGEVAPFLFTGVQILHPRLFDGLSVERFSLNRVYDIAMERERLYGIRHDGDWYHVGTPEGLEEVEKIFRNPGSIQLLF